MATLLLTAQRPQRSVGYHHLNDDSTLCAPYTEQKGSLNQSKPVARHLTVEPLDGDQIKLTIANGPGETIADAKGNLTAKPKPGVQPTSVDFRLDHYDARQGPASRLSVSSC